MDFLTALRLITYLVFSLSVFPTLDLYFLFVRDRKSIKNKAVQRVNSSIVFLLRVLISYQVFNSVRYAIVIANNGVSNEIHTTLNLIQGALFFVATIYLKRVMEFIAKHPEKPDAEINNSQNSTVKNPNREG